MSNLIKNRPFTVPINLLVEQRAELSIADEAKFYKQNVARANHNEEATPPLSLTGMSPDPSYSYFE